MKPEAQPAEMLDSFKNSQISCLRGASLLQMRKYGKSQQLVYHSLCPLLHLLLLPLLYPDAARPMRQQETGLDDKRIS